MSDAQLPPHYDLVESATEAPTVHAQRLATDGAPEGTLVHSPFDRPNSNLDCALILEPEVPVDRYFELAFVAAVSLGQAVAASASPMITLQYGWPDRLVLNDLSVAAVKLVAQDTSGSDPRLIVGVEVSVGTPDKERSDAGTLRSVDSDNQATASDLINLFGRHFLHWINTWHEEGFDSVLAQYIPRLDRAYGSTVSIATRVADPSADVEGIIEHVDSSGALHVSMSDSDQITLSPHQYFGLSS